MVIKMAEMNKTLGEFADIILQNEQVKECMQMKSPEKREVLSEIRSELQIIFSSRIRLELYLIGDVSSGYLYSLFVLMVPLVLTFYFTQI